MKTPRKLPRILIAIAAVIVGLVVGLVLGNVRIKKEQRVFQDKIVEAKRKIAFLEKRMEEEKGLAAASVEQGSQDELNNVTKLADDNKALSERVRKLSGQIQALETKAKASEELAARSGKELLTMERGKKDLEQELQKTAEAKQSLEADLKKNKAEKQALAAEFRKTSQSLGRCESHNAALCLIAEELVDKYRKKGVGTILMQKEPLTQIGKVELEHLVQKYREEIEQQKINKKDVGKNGAQ